ncbi:MAG: glycerophosphodiester phosphodiesterase [Bacteroidetes bacterium]|nr:glycerophosphodiester phosphodiesterase [Bacteroidota bacterium]
MSTKYLLAIIFSTVLFSKMIAQKSFFKHDKPLNFAHRGFSGQFPENTLLSFRNAAKNGANVLELDVHLSSDNKLMVIHDETLDRTTNETGNVNEKSFSYLEKLDASCKFYIDGKTKLFTSVKDDELKIPALSQLFSEFPQFRFNIEIKESDYKTCEVLWDLIQEFKMEEKVLVISSDYKTINYFRNLSKGSTATGASSKEVIKYLLYNTFGMLNRLHFEADAMQIPEYYLGIRLVSKKFIEKAHKKNIFIHVWTINLKPDMVRLLNFGVDGIMTDFPNILNEAVSE